MFGIKITDLYAYEGAAAVDQISADRKIIFGL